MNETKLSKWEILKQQLLDVIPPNCTISVEGLDNDSIYFHPIINVDEDMVFRGQSDVRSHNIYAWRLVIRNPLWGSLYKSEFNIEGLDHIKRLLNNWQKYKVKIMQYVDICKIIQQNIEMLREIQTTIENKLILDTFLQEDKKQCLQKLFQVKEWIENERIIEKYGGL